MGGRSYASQGEQRSLALALRLAGHQLVTERIGSAPVLLLDDVFSELDPGRARGAAGVPAGRPGGRDDRRRASLRRCRHGSGSPRGREAARMTTWRPAPRTAAERDPLPVATSLDRVYPRPRGGPGAGPGRRVLPLGTARRPRDRRPRPPPSLRGGVLVVVVDQPAWAAQLRFMATDLLTRVRAEAEAPDIARARGPHGWSTGGSGAVGARARRRAILRPRWARSVTPLWYNGSHRNSGR